MGRESEFKQGSSNPAKYFLEWKSENKCLSFYDKDKKENVSVSLPFKFVVLKQMNTVRGWNERSASGIFSNEVAFVSKEELNVRSFKGGDIAKGLYKDIKGAIEAAGGHYVRSIYVMTQKGEIVNIQLKGSAVQWWGDFTQKTLRRLNDEWVEIFDSEELKKGKVTYSVPKFQFAGSLDTATFTKADESYETVVAYLKGDASLKEQEVVSDIVTTSSGGDDDLPF